jgi:hypothetical protein
MVFRRAFVPPISSCKRDIRRGIPLSRLCLYLNSPLEGCPQGGVEYYYFCIFYSTPSSEAVHPSTRGMSSIHIHHPPKLNHRRDLKPSTQDAAEANKRRRNGWSIKQIQSKDSCRSCITPITTAEESIAGSIATCSITAY